MSSRFALPRARPHPGWGSGVQANRLPARQGLRWVGDGFRLFLAAPVLLLLMDSAFLAAIVLLLALPVIGMAAAWVLIPALMIGPHALSRAVSRRAAPTLEMLVSGFREHFATQLRLGTLYLVVMIAALAATALADGGHFAQAMAGRVRLEPADLRNPQLLEAMLIGAGLQTAALTALWYAPLLVAWQGLPVAKSVFFSSAAVLINWRPFLVYGLAITLLFAAALFLALSVAMLLAAGRGVPLNAVLFAVLWSLLPVWFSSSYLSYCDVFGAPAANDPAVA